MADTSAPVSNVEGGLLPIDFKCYVPLATFSLLTWDSWSFDSALPQTCRLLQNDLSSHTFCI